MHINIVYHVEVLDCRLIFICSRWHQMQTVEEKAASPRILFHILPFPLMVALVDDFRFNLANKFSEGGTTMKMSSQVII